MFVVAVFVGIILAARKAFRKNKSKSKTKLEKSFKYTFSTTEPHQNDQNNELIPKSPENDETVEETLTVQQSLSQNSGIQTVDDEFLVPYLCPIHQGYGRQDSRLTPKAERQHNDADLTPNLKRKPGRA